MEVKVAPSILSADFGKLNEEIKTIEDLRKEVRAKETLEKV